MSARPAVILALCPILLSGCVTTGAAPAPASQIQLSQAQIRAVEAGVRSSLKDPDSARFGTMAAARRDGEQAIQVCGTVNARNSFGGYTGMQPYFGALTPGGHFVVIGIGGPQHQTTAVMTMCSKVGLSP